MRLSSKKWRWLGLAFGLLVVAFVVIRTWVVPAIILGQVRAHYGGKVVIGDWWFGWRSSGVSGIRLAEGTAKDSPDWFTADRVSTDVSISRLLRGRVMPTKIEVDRPKIAFRLDAKGQPITKIPVIQGPEAKGKPGKTDVSLPDIVTKNGELTLDQVGRKPMTIKGIDARLSPVEDGSKLTVKTDDPDWGQVAINGHFDPSFKKGRFEIDSSPGFVADPSKLERIPFIPAEVWANIEPRGPVDAKVTINLDVDSPKPVTVHTDLVLKGTSAKLNSLQVESTDTTGHVVIDDAVVKLDDLKGKALGGTIGASGKLNFADKVPRFDLNLRLRDVDVTKAPPSWQLGEVGATGRLSGNVDLKVALNPAGPDLNGTAGQAVIEHAIIDGTPIESLSFGVNANGNDLQYAALPEGSVDKKNLDRPGVPPGTPRGRIEIAEPVLAALPVLEIYARNQGFLGWAAYVAAEAVAYQVKHATNAKGGIRLPKTISTQIELADVELSTILAKAKKFGIEIPVPVAGKLSIKASATIPLGALRDIKAYAFRGDATLKAASIDHVDLGIVTAHLELVEGMLDLTNFRGQLVDKPSGDDKNPPPTTAIPPVAGPLPRGAFRGQIRASISPRGDATAKFEGVQLPLGELFAPVLPVPTPVSGDLTLNVEARGDLAHLGDPKSWALDGRLESHRIKYRDAVVDEVVTDVHLKAGKVEIPDFAARLLGRPLKASGNLGLAAPYHFDGEVSIEGWEIAEVLGFVPGLPRPSPASGIVDARGDASGTLQPFDITTRGGARILHARVQAAPLGNVVFQWTTDHETIALKGLEIFNFGGKVTGGARIPIKPGRPLEASATLKGVDTAQIASAFLGKGLTMSGLADGRLKLSMPLDASVVEADAHLTAPDLRIRQGNGGEVSVRSLLVNAVAKQGKLDYDATAEGLGGKVLFHGSAPIAGDPSKAIAEAQLQVVGFRLGEVWKGLGMAGGVSHLDGLGAINTNLRARVRPFQLYGRGLFELRDLRYGKMPPIGNLQGVAAISPTSWQVDQLRGNLFDGVASGEAHSEVRPGGSKVVSFDFKVDRASLAKMTSEVPSLARAIEGFGSLRANGRVAESLEAGAEVLVSRAKVHGVPITDLRFPAEVEMDPKSGAGSVRARNWTARMAGGSVKGNASLRLGTDHTFQSDLQLTGVDLEVLSRLQSNGKKPPSGKVSGKISLSGPNPDQIGKIRGRVDLDLDDASLVEVPIFKELDRFLGGARGGGLFEDGDLHATVYNRTLFVEQLTLNGRLIQVHATGAVTFDGGLNLEVLVNTNQVIPQSGLALVNIIPGLGQALGRGEEALLRVASFLESRLLKFRVTGSVDNPTVKLDPGIAVGDTATGFFSSILKVPLGGRRSD